jgi:hypothetical protein
VCHISTSIRQRRRLDSGSTPASYWLIELATSENTLLEFAPINRIVPTTITKITANITAYSAMS